MTVTRQWLKIPRGFRSIIAGEMGKESRFPWVSDGACSDSVTLWTFLSFEPSKDVSQDLHQTAFGDRDIVILSIFLF